VNRHLPGLDIHRYLVAGLDLPDLRRVAEPEFEALPVSVFSAVTMPVFLSTAVMLQHGCRR